MGCITSWDELRRRLGEPQTILCLGNGPSSELPAILDVTADCVFRANWVWRSRGRHTNPDLVFTADNDLPPADNPPLVCFPTRSDADRILAGWAQPGQIARHDYLVFVDLPLPFVPPSSSHRPTNGALMVAAAARLRPSRLIIAGMDLYRHPDGKYPGLSGEPNQYDAEHDRDADVAFIGAALRQFDGETWILSDQLQSALEAQRLQITGK